MLFTALHLLCDYIKAVPYILTIILVSCNSFCKKVYKTV